MKRLNERQRLYLHNMVKDLAEPERSELVKKIDADLLDEAGVLALMRKASTNPGNKVVH
jgi:hypothetical protein